MGALVGRPAEASPIDAMLSGLTPALMDVAAGERWRQERLTMDDGALGDRRHLLPFEQRDVDGRRVQYAMPASPRGLVYFFHGRGGSSQLVWDVEVQQVLRALFEQGMVIVAPDADSRAERRFVASGDPATNADVQRALAVRAGLIDIGRIEDDTPVFLVGYSAGGWFSGYFGHAALELGIPVRAIAYHQARGRSDTFGDPPDLPSIWLPAANDHIVNPENVAREYERHVWRGGVGLLLWHEPRALDARRFMRDPAVSEGESLAISRAAERTGWFDAQGLVTVSGRDVYRVVRETEAQVGGSLRRTVRAQLRAMLATHRFNGEHAAREVAFFMEHSGLDGG